MDTKKNKTITPGKDIVTEPSQVYETKDKEVSLTEVNCLEVFDRKLSYRRFIEAVIDGRIVYDLRFCEEGNPNVEIRVFEIAYDTNIERNRNFNFNSLIEEVGFEFSKESNNLNTLVKVTTPNCFRQLHEGIIDGIEATGFLNSKEAQELKKIGIVTIE